MVPSHPSTVNTEPSLCDRLCEDLTMNLEEKHETKVTKHRGQRNVKVNLRNPTSQSACVLPTKQDHFKSQALPHQNMEQHYRTTWSQLVAAVHRRDVIMSNSADGFPQYLTYSPNFPKTNYYLLTHEGERELNSVVRV